MCDLGSHQARLCFSFLSYKMHYQDALFYVDFPFLLHVLRSLVRKSPELLAYRAIFEDRLFHKTRIRITLLKKDFSYSSTRTPTQNEELYCERNQNLKDILAGFMLRFAVSRHFECSLCGRNPQ